MVDRVAALMPQQILTPLRSSSLHFEHLVQFQGFQARVRQIKRNSDRGNARRREPLVAQIAVGAERKTARGEFLEELCHPALEFAPRNAYTQIADPPFEQLVFFERHPGRFRARPCKLFLLHDFHRSAGCIDYPIEERHVEKAGSSQFKRCRLCGQVALPAAASSLPSPVNFRRRSAPKARTCWAVGRAVACLSASMV